MFKSMKLGTKIAAGFAALIIIALAISYSGWTNLSNVEALDKVTTNVNDSKQLVSDSRGHIKDFLVHGFATTGTDGKNSVERYEEVYQSQKDGFVNILSSDELSKSDQSLVNAVVRNADDYRAGVDALVGARKSKDAAFKEWGRLGWAITDKVNEAMGDIINPARIEAENSGDIEGVKKWSYIGSGLDQDVIEPFLLLRVTAVYLIATNAEEQWTGYQKQLNNALQGIEKWENFVSGEGQLASAASQIKGYLNEYRDAGTQYHDAILTGKSEYEAIIVSATDMTNNMDKLQTIMQERKDDVVARANIFTLIFSIIGLLIGVGLAFVITRAITKPINRIINGLNRGADQVGSVSKQVASAGQSLAAGASEQASSLEETSSSLEEMASMTRQNSDNTKQADSLAADVNNNADKGMLAMNGMSDAMQNIKKSSDETAKVIKVIDEIAFQTNLLALNAAVEAARAGEAGKGFAVVAEEVRNLAQRSAEAAKETSSMIEGSQKNAEDGVKSSEELLEILKNVDTGIKKVASLLGEITSASDEQAQGVDQINTAVGQLDQVTQQNAANAEESSSASEELSAQAVELQEIVVDLTKVVHGASAGDRGSENQSEHIDKVSNNRKSNKRKSNTNVTAASKTENANDIIPLEEEELVDF